MVRIAPSQNEASPAEICPSRITSPGSTGMTTPKASASSATVTMMKATLPFAPFGAGNRYWLAQMIRCIQTISCTGKFSSG